MNKKITFFILCLVILVLAIFIVGLVINKNNLENQIKQNNTNTALSNQAQNTNITEPQYANLTYSDFKIKDNSPFMTITPEELLALLTTTNSSNSSTLTRMLDSRDVMSSKSIETISTPTAIMDTGISGGSGDSTDYSNTNVQVSGIDEGDIVKTDGEHIFIAKDQSIIVINKVIPPISDENKYTLILNDTNSTNQLYIKAIFIDVDNQLLYVIIEKNLIESKFTEYSVLYPQMDYIPFTVVNTYKINDSSLDKLNSIEIKGNYYESRMKNKIVYIITSDYLNNFRPIAYYDTVMIPVSETKNNEISNFQPKIVVPRDVTEESKVMYNLTTLEYNENNSSIKDSLNLVLDSSNTLYMSNNNIYIATQKNMYYPFYRFGGYYSNTTRDIVFEAIYDKIYPNNVSSQIKDNLNDQNKLVEILNEYYNTLDQDEKEELYTKISEESDKYYQERRVDYDKTYINRIELKDNGLFGDVTQGEVKGRLLNQFSLDESDEYLRIATTYRDYNGYNSTTKNAVTILDSSLQEVGLLDNLASGETIYSARFMGTKLYLVTYRQVDPFFVIDLASPQNPEVLGYLKISGYSDYLHPISDTLILGIGQETETNEWGGETRTGVKVALFDVSVFEDPKEIGKWVSSASYSNTTVSYDHKAFLYIEKNNLVVIPISESYNTTTPKFGFVVLKADSNGVNKVTTIEHTNPFNNNYYYTNITRSLYIDNELYTISDYLLKTYNFDTEEQTELSILTDGQYIDGYPSN